MQYVIICFCETDAPKHWGNNVTVNRSVCRKRSARGQSLSCRRWETITNTPKHQKNKMAAGRKNVVRSSPLKKTRIQNKPILYSCTKMTSRGVKYFPKPPWRCPSPQSDGAQVPFQRESQWTLVSQLITVHVELWWEECGREGKENGLTPDKHFQTSWYRRGRNCRNPNVTAETGVKWLRRWKNRCASLRYP